MQKKSLIQPAPVDTTVLALTAMVIKAQIYWSRLQGELFPVAALPAVLQMSGSFLAI